jgi:hypothetical protein
MTARRMSPRLQPCRCRVSKPCLTCMRWLRVYRNVQARRAAPGVRT